MFFISRFMKRMQIGFGWVNVGSRLFEIFFVNVERAQPIWSLLIIHLLTCLF